MSEVQILLLLLLSGYLISVSLGMVIRMLMNGARFYNIQESLLFFRFSPDMFRRRGGWRYAVTEVRLQALFYKMGFIGFFSLLKNVCIRLVTRLLPNGLRSLLYKRLIRG